VIGTNRKDAVDTVAHLLADAREGRLPAAADTHATREAVDALLQGKGVDVYTFHDWQVLDAQGMVLAEASHVVIAAGAGSSLLLGHRWALAPVRGQLSWGLHDSKAPTPGLAPFPVNGHGNLIPVFPAPTGAIGSQHASAGSTLAWVMGSTFERGVEALPPSPADQRAAHAASLDKLRTLLPQAAASLGGVLDAAVQTPAGGEIPHARAARSWAAVRCTSPDRLPIVGPVDAQALPGLWACTAMGSRGLTFAALCAQLLVARLHGDPLPLPQPLAAALDLARQRPV
jgi:tRNA 5-methylaminomethyl-2-thiouridine biosynthesis bifunctional protein